MVTTLFRYGLLGLVLMITIFPMLWMLRVALLPKGLPLTAETLLSVTVTGANVLALLDSDGLVRPFFNSLVVGGGVTIGNILFGFMCAYALSRYRLIENRFILFTVLAVLFVPVHIVIIPLYLLAVESGLYDTYGALILPFLVNPIGIFLVKQYLDGIPTAMEEAARVDGASEFRILFQIVMPMARPALVVLAIQVFFTNWNSFLFPFILTSRSDLHTLPVALAMIQGRQGIEWPELMAGATLAVVPVLVVFVILQRHIVSGITAGAIKQ